ncbi:MFS transporter [Phyllobacteriaceae bacterium JZ32]
MNEWTPSSPPGEPAREKAAWGAVSSMTLGVFGLVTAEFLPASLLTPMAAELGITEGAAGQAVTATAVVALITSLLVSAATRRINRRHLLLVFSTLLIVSNLLVAFAPSLPILIVGRVLLGIALGGFWTMAAAITMRLVPEALIPRALSILFSGVSAATVLAAPVGSLLGDIMGWRGVFLIAAGLGVLTLIVQFVALPSLAPTGSARLRTLVDLLLRPGVGLGLIALTLEITGHFALFTYIRPFLEIVTGAGIASISAILLGFGVANFLGTYVGGVMLERSLRLTLFAMPLVMGLLGLGLAIAGSALLPAAAMVALWGFAFGAVPVAWSTWITRTIPDEAETGGGLLVAAFQLAIATGAGIGGVIFDTGGAIGVFTAGGGILLAAALIIGLGVKPQRALAAASA